MLKHAFFFGALFFGAFLFVGTAEVAAQSDPVVGGYQKAKKLDPEVIQAAGFAVKEQGEGFRLLKISKAEKQVVAGMNYRLRLKVAERSGDKEAKYDVTAVVYRDLDGNLSLTSWKKAAK